MSEENSQVSLYKFQLSIGNLFTKEHLKHNGKYLSVIAELRIPEKEPLHMNGIIMQTPHYYGPTTDMTFPATADWQEIEIYLLEKDDLVGSCILNVPTTFGDLNNLKEGIPYGNRAVYLLNNQEGENICGIELETTLTKFGDFIDEKMVEETSKFSTTAQCTSSRSSFIDNSKDVSRRNSETLSEFAEDSSRYRMALEAPGEGLPFRVEMSGPKKSQEKILPPYHEDVAVQTDPIKLAKTKKPKK